MCFITVVLKLLGLTLYVYISLFDKFESYKYLLSIWFSLNRDRLLDIKTICIK